MIIRAVLSVLAVGIILAAAPVRAAGQSKAPARLAVGDVFPRLEAEFLTGRKAVLPDAATGRWALVMMGFTYDSRFDVEKWAEHLRREFGANESVTFFEVPVIGGMGRLASWFINSGMRKGTPKELHENVITVYGDADRWKTVMGFSKSEEDAAYISLLAPDGRVQWMHHGGFSDTATAALKAAIASGGAAAPIR